MYTLYIGNKNYSSWSLRPWVLMKTFGIPFHEERILLYEAESPARIRAVSPSGKLPCLHDGDVIVWDTMAIAEYLAERHAGLWPGDPVACAWARSAAAEMHSGFANLRNEMGMNLRVRQAKQPSSEVAADIARVEAMWREGRERFGHDGEFLCGSFSIVDAFYCPVAFRFHSYGVHLAGSAGAYTQALLALPAMREWADAAARETEHIPRFDPQGLPPQQSQRQWQ